MPSTKEITVPAFTTLTVTETKLLLREPITAFFALAFAPMLLVILGLVPALREADPELGGARAIDRYLPILVAMGVAMFALSGLSQLFASYREKGVLRRLRTTPVAPGTMIGAQLAMALGLSVITLLLMLVLGRWAFDVRLPERPVAYLLSFLLIALAMFACGLFVAAFAPNTKAASAIGTLTFFPLIFFAGLWVPRTAMNDVLRTISDLTPLGAGVQSLQDAAAGEWPHLLHLGVLVGWTVVAGGLAARYFRWE
ncbi:ABC transporter permease [Cryptosporangium sp. NPDC048952]|uniref:ABC transporter permease n=1 Tax=Cryptosporangium sp. NPDC048952 TaxID=3363961 RepID=UPI003719CD79